MATDTAPVTDAKEFDVTLDEYCAGLSGMDKRVELIGAFHHVEQSAGHLKDSKAAFQGRFEAFVSQPA